MAKNRYGAALRHVHALFAAGTTGGLTDGQLLDRFVTRDGEAAEFAFTALVERHGPMVLRICRALLRDPHDAEDAFQATFLVLARRAGSVRDRDSAANWLHGVARRVASSARSAAARRRAHERRVAEMARRSADAEDWDDLGVVLHEEIERLSGPYRTAVVLCDLEGLTEGQAARRLGWPIGTVRSRLTRGRERLRARLMRRGLTPSALLPGPTLSTRAAPVPVPAELTNLTARAAVRSAAGWSAAEVASESVASLTERGLRTMTLTRIKVIAAALLAIGVASAAACSLPPLQDARAGERRSVRPANVDGAVANRIFALVHTEGDDDGWFQGLVAINPDNGDWEEFTSDKSPFCPRVSPDGQSLLYVDGEHDGVFRCDIRGGDPVRIADGRGVPLWSPDGKQIIFSEAVEPEPEARADFRWTAWRFQVDGSGRMRLPLPETGQPVDWSPDGKWLATLSGGMDRLVLVRPDGTDARELAAAGLKYYPRFSPDGRRVSFGLVDNEEHSIWVADIEGEGRRRVFKEDHVGLRSPACWSPDGKRLAVVLFDWKRLDDDAYEHTNFRVEVMDADGGNRRALKLPRWQTAIVDWR